MWMCWWVAEAQVWRDPCVPLQPKLLENAATWAVAALGAEMTTDDFSFHFLVFCHIITGFLFIVVESSRVVV